MCSSDLNPPASTFRGTVEAGGFTISDENGLHSLNNFTSDISFGTDDSTVSTSDVDAPITPLTFTLSRSSKLLITYSAALYNSTSPELATVSLYIDGAVNDFAEIGGTANYVTIGNTVIVTLSEGSHTLMLKYRAIGAGTALITNPRIQYVSLGN